MIVIGIVILVLGIVLLGIGWNISKGIKEKLVRGITGHFTQHTRWYFIGGIALIIIGGALALFGWRQ